MSPKKLKKLEKSFKFFSLAETAASYSADKSTKVGAVALDKRLNVICIGYNGFPRGVKDTPELHDRPLKYSVTCHAEENVVSQAAYIGASLRESTLIVTALFPCSTCARLILQSGIKRIIVGKIKQDPKWDGEAVISKRLFLDAGTEIIVYDKETKTWERME